MRSAWREAEDQAAFVRVAWHEAGHAVVARALGRSVTLVEVDPSGTSGRCVDVDLDRADRRAVQDELVILVAGDVAVEVAAKRDWKQLRLARTVSRETRRRPFAPGEVPAGEIRQAGLRASDILARRWDEVDALQGELLLQGNVLEREWVGRKAARPKRPATTARRRAVGDLVVMRDGKRGKVVSVEEARRAIARNHGRGTKVNERRPAVSAPTPVSREVFDDRVWWSACELRCVQARVERETRTDGRPVTGPAIDPLRPLPRALRIDRAAGG